MDNEDVPRTLIVHSTVDGHTLTICRHIQRRLEALGHAVVLQSVDEALPVGCAGYDRVLVGASIRYGHHRPAVHAFVERHRDALGGGRAAFFSVCAVARKPGKDTPEGNPYLRKFLQRSGWRPALAVAFGGRIDYARYGPLDRTMIRFIMWLTHGPTDPGSAVEFTDWPAVDRFADRFAGL